ncbi:xanthine dehydrogenase small subunit [Vibrio nigripulchritudo]|uniref:xanthine dehydrogenase small subunit n=1 Tax=Vibrio nigripulchritudo TaxID=28173 RepID=UPI0005F9C5E5|nr:xanthine dehydrogenase small subunit [Vibrio nigripulchritudo]KJY75205.1 FAD-binding molybdopterin dehydrogenase [Vibrio nigripulchritudo]
MISFLLNQSVQHIEDLSPNTTVLQYLRTQLRKTGTKEGCGSGDCGACTVVLGEVVDGRLVYQSVNSCLTFVSSLHGKQLITVEDLKDPSGCLHPVQQAMVEFHGSQCGFCTPGFIMSMFALLKNKPKVTKHDVMEALSGNLCRCTGYRPIVDAALSLNSNQNLRDQFSALEEKTIAHLNQLSAQKGELTFGNFQSYLPTSTDELASLLVANPDARLVAGGTDLALEVTQFHKPIQTLISLASVANMKECKLVDDSLVIGANVTLSNAYQALSQHFPDFGELLHRFASLQIRNQGTLGGNIANASPIGDSPPLLIALGAKVALRCGNETRTLLLEDYFIRYKVTAQKPGEFIESIHIPLLQPEHTFKAYKLSKRLDDDISAVCGAFNLTIQNGKVTRACIAFGGMAEIPKRAKHCENALIDQDWNENSILDAMKMLVDDFEPLSDFRATREYRALAAANLLRRFYIESTHPHNQIETRVTSYV